MCQDGYEDIDDPRIAGTLGNRQGVAETAQERISQYSEAGRRLVEDATVGTAKVFLAATGGQQHVHVLDPGQAQDVVLTVAEYAQYADLVLVFPGLAKAGVKLAVTQGGRFIFTKAGKELAEAEVRRLAKEITEERAKKFGAEAAEQVGREAAERAAREGGECGTKTYQTYTKTRPSDGSVYSGRTSGTGTPAQNVAKRDAGHHMNKEGYGKAKLDQSAADPAAIRGREQQLIDNFGGARSSGGTSGNKYNGISPRNKRLQEYLDAARRMFGGS